jgi:hypothetical protein
VPVLIPFIKAYLKISIADCGEELGVGANDVTVHLELLFATSDDEVRVFLRLEKSSQDIESFSLVMIYHCGQARPRSAMYFTLPATAGGQGWS